MESNNLTNGDFRILKVYSINLSSFDIDIRNAFLKRSHYYQGMMKNCLKICKNDNR